nr:hypothetical protein [Tanacetum cinerariifolium]
MYAGFAPKPPNFGLFFQESTPHFRETPGTHNGEAGSSRSKLPKQHETVEEILLPQVHLEFLLWEGCSQYAKSRATGYDKVRKIDLFLLSMFKARHQNGYAIVAWVITKWMKWKGAGTQKESQICYGQFILKLARKCWVLTKDVDLYDRMGRMEIRQDAIERMEYRQPYQWDKYHGVFENMAGAQGPGFLWVTVGSGCGKSGRCESGGKRGFTGLAGNCCTLYSVLKRGGDRDGSLGFCHNWSLWLNRDLQ